jgi:hypothetical protein
MAAIVGTKGSIAFGGVPGPTDLASGGTNAVTCFRWTLNIVGETHDITPFHATNNYRKFVRGLYTANGTAEGYLDSGEAHDLTPYQTPTASHEFVLTASSGRTYTFNGFITGFNITVEATGLNRYTATFIASDDIDEV